MTREEAVALLERYSNYDGMGIPNLAGCKEAMKVAVDALKEAFPELAESEDERIRKALIWHLKAGEDFVSNGVTKAECLAYLEKQKEQKPINHNFTTFHRDVVYCAMCDKNLDEGLRCNLEIVYKIIKDIVDRTPVVEEQKPTATINGEPIPTENHSVDIPLAEWSEEDEKMLQSIIKDFRAGKVSTIGQERWLKSLRSQPKQEWSKDDERCWNLIWDILDGPFIASESGYKKARDWFIENCPKGYKHSQSSWKPSQEQMYALLNAEGFLRAGLQHDSAKTIADLYEQLKKL